MNSLFKTDISLTLPNFLIKFANDSQFSAGIFRNIKSLFQSITVIAMLHFCILLIELIKNRQTNVLEIWFHEVLLDHLVDSIVQLFFQFSQLLQFPGIEVAAFFLCFWFHYGNHNEENKKFHFWFERLLKVD